MNTNITIVILAELLVKSAAIIAATSLLHSALHRLSAAKRHYLWVAAFATLLLLPLSKCAQPLWVFALQRSTPETAITPKPIPGLELVDGALPAPADLPAVDPKHRVRLTSWKSTAIVTWVAGSVLIIGYHLLGSIRLGRLERDSVPVDDPRLESLMRSAVDEASIKRPIALRASQDAGVAFTWGAWRPVLMLPRDWIEWGDDRLLTVLRHEIAHIARNDYLMRRLAQLVSAIYWPNPFVWLAGASLRRAQEQACDDHVLRHGTTPEDYATLLFESVRALRQDVGGARHALAMARPSTLECRVVAIVDDTRDRRPAGLSGMVAAAPIVAVSLTISALAQVENEAPRPVPAFDKPPVPVFRGAEEQTKVIKNKAEATVITAIDFRQVSLKECLTFLRQKSMELDPKKEGINFAVKLPNDDPAVTVPITLSARNISLLEALNYITKITNTSYRIEPHAIAMQRRNPGALIQTEYKLSRKQFLAAFTDLKGRDLDNSGRVDAKELLKGKGISFGDGASAAYIDASETPIVRNTEENLDLIDWLVNAAVKANPRTEPAKGAAGPSANQAKLEKLIIPMLEFRGVTVKEAVDFLSKKVQELDPEKSGVKFEFNAPPAALEKRITLSVQNIPASEALKYLTTLVNLKYRTLPDGRVIIES